jgi:hypothetical protein
MLAYVILPAMAIAGYLGAPVWLVLFGVAGIASEGWWAKLQRLRQQPRQPWSTKVVAYFVTGILANLALAALSFAAGRLVRATLG